MRIAVYIEKGFKQIILTPEDEFEKSVLRDIDKSQYDLSIQRGEFYHCQGGWLREKDYLDLGEESPKSTMFILKEKIKNE